MGPSDIWRFLLRRLGRQRRGLKSFEQELKRAGGMASGVDRGFQEVPTEKVVGSVGRWRNLRSDFFYRTGKAMTRRFYRIGEAMEEGKPLPPLELYKLKRPGPTPGESAPSEYYVVDGHHRVAMARKFGQLFHDAHVTEFRGASPSPQPAPAPQPEQGERPDTTTS